MFNFLASHHQRTYPFRPARRHYDQHAGRMGLYFRFFMTYAWPFRWGILFVLFFACTEACSTYLLSYYTKVVVDGILVVEPPAASTAKPGTVSREARPQHHDDILPTGRKPPTQSLGERMDRGIRLSRRPADAAGRLFSIFLAYAGTILFLNLMSRVSSRTRIRVGQAITTNLRDDMHRKVMILSMSYHNTQNPGRLLSRILYDVSTVQDQMLQTIINTGSQVLMIGVGFVILLGINLKLALLACIVLPFYILIHNRSRILLRETNMEQSHTNSCTYGLVAQKFDAIKAVQAYGREKHESLNFHRISAVFLRDALANALISSTMNRSCEILSSIGTNALVFLCGAVMVLNGEITLGTLLFAHGTAASLFGPVVQLSNTTITMSKLLVSLRRLAEILDEPVEIRQAGDAVRFPSPLRRGIELRNLRFRYNADSEPVFQDISLHVPAGSTLCIMGASGTGKTTLLLLLARIYQPDGGDILFDGIPLDKIDLGDLRTKVGLVPQEAQIFSGTVRDNICYGSPEATPTMIMRAAKAAELHDFILTLKVQYETLLGEKGTSLSGGQKQRLSLARALLTDPDLLLLDDCTSALDAATERKIQDTLQNVLTGKTSIIVSQRISMARRCDRIAVLANGVIAEYGTHAELVARGGFYSRLHAQQTEA